MTDTFSDPVPPRGLHVFAELSGCDCTILNNEDALRKGLELAVEKSGATLLQLTSHSFSPQGVTVLGLLAESHISIHAWPEAGYAAVDCFTCGDRCDPLIACETLADIVKAGHTTYTHHYRGVADTETAKVEAQAE